MYCDVMVPPLTCDWSSDMHYRYGKPIGARWLSSSSFFATSDWPADKNTPVLWRRGACLRVRGVRHRWSQRAPPRGDTSGLSPDFVLKWEPVVCCASSWSQNFTGEQTMAGSEKLGRVIMALVSEPSTGDRSDVPDLFRFLAGPVSFPRCEDAGEDASFP